VLDKSRSFSNYILNNRIRDH